MKKHVLRILLIAFCFTGNGLAVAAKTSPLYARYDTAECRMLEAQAIKKMSMNEHGYLPGDNLHKPRAEKISMVQVIGIILLCALAAILLFCVLL